MFGHIIVLFTVWGKKLLGVFQDYEFLEKYCPEFSGHVTPYNLLYYLYEFPNKFSDEMQVSGRLTFS
jgi:hypothetical protein